MDGSIVSVYTFYDNEITLFISINLKLISSWLDEELTMMSSYL